MNPTWLYVAAVYAGAIAVARRAGVAVPARVAALFYLLVLGYLLEPMTARTVNIHADVLETLPPWVYLGDVFRSAKNGIMNDVPLQIVPWAHKAREAWKSGSAPLWNESVACGMPLLGNGQSAGLSPLRLLALPLSLGHAMAAEAAMKLLVALTFMFLYCRRRFSEMGSLIAAVLFGFSGFLFAWLHFPLASVACWFPAVFLSIELLGERPTFSRCATAAVVGAAVVYGGQPEAAAYIFLAAILYVLWLRPPWKHVAAMVGTVFVAALLAAPHLAMFGEAMRKSTRYVNLQRFGWSTTQLPSSYWHDAVVLLLPDYFGPINKPWGPAGPDSVTGFAGALGVAAWFAMAWWIVKTRSWRSIETFFVLFALLVFGAVFEWPGFTGLFHFLIPLGAHARLRLIFAFALAVLAAATVDRAREHPRAVLFGAVMTAALLAAIYIAVPFPEVLTGRRPAAILATIPAIAVLIAIVVVSRSRKDLAAGALFAAVVAEMFVGGRWFNTVTPDELMYRRTELIRKLQDLQASAGQPARFVGWGPMLFPNVSAILGLEDIRVHDPMSNHRYLQFLRNTSTYDPQTYFAFWEDTTTHVLDFLNVRYLVEDPGAPRPEPGRWNQVYEGREGRIYENRDVLPRFYAVRNVVAEFRDEAFAGRLREMDDKWQHTALVDELRVENRRMHDDFFSPRPEGSPEATVNFRRIGPAEYAIRTSAPRYTLIVSSIAWWPGWTVERDGKRAGVIRVNGAFIGFAVPPGTSEVRLFYAPAIWRYSVIVALATALALIAIGIYGSIARGRAYRRASAEA